MYRLNKNGVCKTLYFHHLIWDNFSNVVRDIQIDHIDGNKLNNNISNLQLLSCRDNVSKSKMKKKSSKYTGVYWNKRDKIWGSYIYIDGKVKNLGSFDNEYDAYLTYQQVKNNIE